jgi:6-phosphogluconolactonase (cycloisomerase 2 family)
MNAFCSGSSRRLVLLSFSSILIQAITACSGGNSVSTSPQRTLTSIAVNADKTAVAAGLTAQFKATGTYSDSSTGDITNSVTWTSASPSVATVNTSGLATSKIQGTAIISAASSGVTGSATLTVNAPALLSIAVKAATVQLGTTAQMKATGTFTDQSTQDVTGGVAWTSTNAYVASVNDSGVVTSTGAGSSSVTAVQGNVQGTAPVTVLASPRYLYVSADSGRTMTRMAIDSNTGQPRFAGYTSTAVLNNIGFPCLTVDPSGTHAYLSTQVQASGGSGYAGTVAIYAIDPVTGNITTLPGSPFSVSFPLGCVRFAPSGKFAYATSGIEDAGDQLGTFAVNADGTLTLNNTVSFPFYPTGVAVDPIGHYLYVNVVDVLGGTLGSSQLYGYSIDATTGELTALDGSPFAIDAGVYGLLSFHPSGNSLYASNLNDVNILQYSINRTTGAPTKASSVDSTCINPSALQFLPDGSHAYALCGESSSRSVSDAPIQEFTVAASGQLTLHSSAFAGPVAQLMQVDESAKFLYVLGSGNDAVSNGNNGTTVATNTVLAYQIQPDGSLKVASQSAGHVLAQTMLLVSGPTPVTWATTNAYVTTSGDNQVSSYNVAADGALTAGQSLPTSSGPFSATTLPWGSDLLFASQATTPNLFGYAISGTTISSGSSFGSASSTGGIVIDPTGQLAYASDPVAGAVDVFHCAFPGYWSAALVSGGAPFTYSAGAGAGPITMDPSGRYIAVANQGDNSISLIEPLGAAPTPATVLGYTPLSINVDGTGNLIFVAGNDGKLHMLSSNGLGTLTEVASGALLAANTASVAIDPFSRFVYAAGPAGLNAFAIDQTANTLTPISLSLSVPLANATGAFLDPSGTFLYVPVSNGSTNALYLFTVNADGTLTASNANPVATPKGVTSMVFRANVQ